MYENPETMRQLVEERMQTRRREAARYRSRRRRLRTLFLGGTR
jgi:hypothetical protein